MELKVSRKYTLENISEKQFKMIYQALVEMDTRRLTKEKLEERCEILDIMRDEHQLIRVN